jgi:hypothetical protein
MGIRRTGYPIRGGGVTHLAKAVLKRRASDHIRQIPARNLHHAIRLATSKGLPLNLFVSFNLTLTRCPEYEADLAFQLVRTRFSKWIRRAALTAPPTFVWVIENPNGCLNAHWLLHVPAARHAEFKEKLPLWVTEATGEILASQAIDVRPAEQPTRFERYMLKGMFPSMARNFGIRPEPQGWVTGRRIGHSRNLGPVQVAALRRLGKHPPASRWIHGKYDRDRVNLATMTRFA